MTEPTGTDGSTTAPGPRIVVGYSSRPEGRAAL